VSRLQETFSRLKEEGRGAYIPYVCIGDPDMESSLNLVRALEESGADVFEFGIPFSDPIADGPVIQGAMARSLDGGTRTKDVLRFIRSLREGGMDRPIVIMTYYNPVLQYGEARFCRDLVAAGGDGLLVVDLPPEESALLDNLSRENGLDVIRLVAPTTPAGRMSKVLQGGTGYVYAVAVAGVTGGRKSMSQEAVGLLQELRERTELPIALGFGISSPEHVREAMRYGADAVVEGSNLVSIYSSGEHPLSLVRKHVREMVSMLPVKP